jgi:choline dehydrogenase-like flavoprotein
MTLQLEAAERVVRGAELAGESTVVVDACVIGTGAGGAPVAAGLAEGGMSVAMLEEGERLTVDDVTARPREMTTRLYRDAGQLVTVGNVPIMLPLGRGVGGTTFVNSGTCFRTPARVLERWARDYGLEELTPEALEPYFEEVERSVHVEQVTPSIAGKNALVVKRGTEALGWSGDFIHRNATGCVGSGVCAFGCPTGAKQHTGLTYVPRAWDAGATTYTGVRARKLRVERGSVRGVEARTAAGGRLRVEADLVIVACGAIHTPLLLAANRLGGDSGQLGRNLAIHPATAVRALFDEEIDMARGVPQSYYIDQFASERIMFEGAAGPPDYLAMSFPFSRERHRDLMLRYRHLSQFGVMVSDRSRGSVTRRAGRLVVRYDLCPDDVAAFERGIDLLAELYRAAGAREIFLPVAEGAGRPLQARDLTLMAFHPLGTARADARAARGVVDGDLKVHGVDGLYVSDASVIPSSLGVNPQITIMALASRLAEHLLR